MQVKHAKTNNIADWTQAELNAQIALGNYPAGTLLADIVQPSDWNADHVIIGPWKDPVDLVNSAGNVNIASAPASFDGVTATVGWRIALINQTAPAQAGIYIFNGVGVAMTRATDYDTDAKIRGSAFMALRGASNAGKFYRNTNLSTITVGTTFITITTFVQGGTGTNIGTNGLVNISNTGVVAGGGGSANDTLVYTVNAQGQLTAISATAISISNSQVYDFGSGVFTYADDWYNPKPWKNEVNIAVPFPVDNINALLGNTIDGVVLDSKRTFLLYLQSDTSQNGLYRWVDGNATPRLDWKDKGMPDGAVITVTEGDINGGHLFKFTTKGDNLSPNQTGDNFVRIETSRDLYKQPVDVATSALDETDIEISTLLQAGNTLNPSAAYPVTLTAGMRVMVKNQTDGGSNANQNGIYIVPDSTYGSTVVRASDFYTDQDVHNAIVPVKGGEYRGTVWQVQASVAETSVIVDSNNVWFTEIARIGYGGEKKVIPTNGSYTPSIVSSNNIDTSSASEAQWSRIGDLIIVSGELTATPTTTTSGTYVELSLPVDTNMGGSTFLLAGTAASGDLKPSAAKVYGGSNSAFIFWDAQIADEYTWSYIYQYKLNQP